MTLDPPTLSVCTRCRPQGWSDSENHERPGTALARALQTTISTASLPEAVALRRVRCMSQCLRPCVIAFSHRDRFTYLFGDLDPDRHAEDVLAALRTWLSRSDGFMERNVRPPSLRRGILGRIPPLDRPHELIESETLVP